MGEREVLSRLEDALSHGEEAHPMEVLAFLAGRRVAVDDELLHGARRRAVQLLAAGGDPFRGLDLDGRAVRALADDLDRPERRAELGRGLAELRAQADGLPLVTGRLEALEQEPDQAWRWFACALLAEELTGDADDE
jgi:hypothetical protein